MAKKGFLLRDLTGTDPVETGRDCSSEGLDHMATNHGARGSTPSPKALKWKALDFPSGGRKVMIGIENTEFFNLGYSHVLKWKVLIAEQVYISKKCENSKIKVL